MAAQALPFTLRSILKPVSLSLVSLQLTLIDAMPEPATTLMVCGADGLTTTTSLPVSVQSAVLEPLVTFQASCQFKPLPGS